MAIQRGDEIGAQLGYDTTTKADGTVVKVPLVKDISGGGGGGDASAANQVTGNNTLTSIDGHVDGLETLVAATNTALGTPFQAGGSIGNTSFISTGNAASGATDSGNPVKIGGRYNSTLPTLTDGQRGDAQLGTRGSLSVQLVRADSATPVGSTPSGADGGTNSYNGLIASAYNHNFNGTTWDRGRGDTSGQVNQPYALTGSRIQYAAASGGISNTTTAVTMFAAAGAGLRNYITSLQLSSDALGAATELAIRDGAAGTVIWRSKIGTGGITAGESIVFPVPLKGTANTLMEVVTLTASVTGAVYVNAQGYTAA